MAGAPQFKVYDSHGTYQAACKEPEAAACLMGLYGDGATVRVGHAKRDTVWTEGPDGDGDAGESYDETAETIQGRLDRRDRETMSHLT